MASSEYDISSQVEQYPKESYLWRSGVDVVNAREREIPFGTHVLPVFFPDGSLPKGVSPYQFATSSDFGNSTRSRLAQSLFEVNGFYPQDQHTIVAIVTNHSRRSLLLPAGEGITQVFDKSAMPLQGADLHTMIMTGGMMIGDSIEETIAGYGYTWHFFGERGEMITTRQDAHRAKGIAVALSQNALVVPPKDQPINVFAHSDHRQIIDRDVLAPSVNGEHREACVRESVAPIRLHHAHSVIDTDVSPHAYHINSPLLERGITNWNVRFEFVGDTSEVSHVRLYVHSALL